MKEPRSRAGSSGKATKTEAGPAAVKPAKATMPAKAAATTRATRPAKASATAKTAAATRTATRNRTAGDTDYRKEIDSLRREVDKLKAQLAKLHDQSGTAARGEVGEDPHPWLKIAATVGVTFVLGKLMQALRVPAAAAVAVPLITAEVNRRIL